MGSHPFNFDGGSELNNMGAVWFVSYAFYTHVDNTHTNWKKVKTHPNRKSVFNRTGEYHQFWLEKVAEMKDENLNTNTLGLEAGRIKEMARDCLRGLGNGIAAD
jgi:hypothetical protein